MNIEGFFEQAAAELQAAQKAYTPFVSAHEGWAVMAEELDELWEMVRFPQRDRNPEAMRRECIQIAAMAARFAVELCDTGVVNER